MVYCSAKMSRHRQNGLSFVPKKIFIWVPREASGGLKVTAGKRVTTLLPLYPHNVLLVSVSFRQHCFLWQDMFKTSSIDIVGLSQAELQKTY